MTYEEAIKMIPRVRAKFGTANFTRTSYAAQEWFDCIGKALEKQIPKKPHSEGDGYWACPNCDEKYEYYNELDCLKWCSACGQAIDWSEE